MPTSRLPRPTVDVVLGTRPEAVKLAPVVLALRGDGRFDTRVVHTGQHRELAADVLDAFGIRPDIRLDLLRPGQDLPSLLGRAVTEIGARLGADPPDAVVVQGDTTTATAAALAAAQLRIPVAHVEAGLRSGDRRAPFPEEDNRRLISVVADLHLAPTEPARHNLLAEGVAPAKVVVTGNTGIDALHSIVAIGPSPGDAVAGRVARHAGPVILVTTHRRESWGAPMAAVAGAVRRLVEAEPTALAVVPMHPNPGVRAVLTDVLADHDRVVLCDAVPYATLAFVLSRAAVVLTDSGGIQEEAPSLGVPVLVLRDTTERPEGVAAGTALLVGTDPQAIFAASRRVLHDPAVRASMAQRRDVYGDGQASARVVEAVATLVGLAAPARDFAAAGGWMAPAAAPAAR